MITNCAGPTWTGSRGASPETWREYCSLRVSSNDISRRGRNAATVSAIFVNIASPQSPGMPGRGMFQGPVSVARAEPLGKPRTVEHLRPPTPCLARRPAERWEVGRTPPGATIVGRGRRCAGNPGNVLSYPAHRLARQTEPPVCAATHEVEEILDLTVARMGSVPPGSARLRY